MFSTVAETLLKNKEIITLATEIFTAVGTVAAVIVALWLSYRDSKLKQVASKDSIKITLESSD